MANKIIFLDVDGVICTMRTRFFNLDKYCLKLLGIILWLTDAKIVVSSAWRRGELGLTKRRLLERGFPFQWHHRIIAETPSIYFEQERLQRGYEIRNWLYNNGYRYDFEKYIIFDDDTDMLYQQRKQYIRTSSYFGLNLWTMWLAIYKLNFKPYFKIRNAVQEFRLKLWRAEKKFKKMEEKKNGFTGTTI